ncbi:hypothetical protein KSS87_021357, partial [Heliosperma pusillum]
MSRCFPFPPSGYSRNCSSNQNDALIYSIKLQEQKEKSIPDRVKESVKSSDKKKDRKSDKKDRKKDKKEKKDKKRVEKDKLNSVIENGKQKPDDKLFNTDGFEKKEFNGKRSFEVLERSNLTEEHGRPVDLQNVSCSSDSTGNSSKRKKLSSPASSIQGTGNIIRIRLSSKKRDEPSTSCIIPARKIEDNIKSQADLRPCSISVPVISQTNVIGKVQEPLRVIQETKVEPLVTRDVISQTNVIAKVLEPLRPFQKTKVDPLATREEPSTSGRIENREQPSKKLSSHERKMLKKETLYNSLFQNLVPPMLKTEQVADLDDGDDWLFGK